MKKWSFRRAHFQDTQEMQFIVTTDTQIPHLFEHDFPTDPQITKNRFNYFIEKFTEKDFFDVAIDEQNQIIGFHAIKIQPYFNNLLMGDIVTLWVAPDYRRLGIASDLKKRAELWAQVHQLDHLSTMVHKNNLSMIALNKEMGFEITTYQMKKKIEIKPQH